MQKAIRKKLNPLQVLDPTRPRMVPLDVALVQVAASERHYYRTRGTPESVLPPGVKRGGRWFFLQQDIDAHVLRMAGAASDSVAAEPEN